MKTLLAILTIAFASSASAQTVTFPTTVTNSITVTNVIYFITTNIFQTNIYPVTLIQPPPPLVLLTNEFIDANQGRRFWGLVTGPTVLRATNFNNSSSIMVYLDNPQLFPVRWPECRWNGSPPSATNPWPRVLLESVNGRLEGTKGND